MSDFYVPNHKANDVVFAQRNAAPPKTAFMTHGFPRPLLTGDRLKDRLKERPASISSALGAVAPSR